MTQGYTMHEKFTSRPILYINGHQWNDWKIKSKECIICVCVCVQWAGSERITRNKKKKVAYGTLMEYGIYNCGDSFIGVMYTNINSYLKYV